MKFARLAVAASVLALGAFAVAVGVDCTSSTNTEPSEGDSAIPSYDSAPPTNDSGSVETPEAGADATADAATPADSGPPIDSGFDAGVDSGLAIDAGPCNGVCVALASNLPNVLGIAADGTNVYWTTDNGSGTVAGTPVGGDGGVFTLATGQSDPFAIATDGTNVYWVTYGNGVSGEGAVMMAKAASDGGPVVTLAASQNSPEYIAVCPPTVFWTNEHDVYSVNNDGGDPEMITANGAYSVACNPSAVYWGDGNNLLWAPTPIVDESAYSVLEPGPYGNGVAANTTSLYWGGAGPDGGIWKAPLDGGTPVNLCGAAGPETIAIDDQSVYWTNPTAGTVWKVALGGGAPVLLAWDQDQPWTVTVDSTSVYWTDLGTGTVMKLTPK